MVAEEVDPGYEGEDSQRQGLLGESRLKVTPKPVMWGGQEVKGRPQKDREPKRLD